MVAHMLCASNCACRYQDLEHRHGVLMSRFNARESREEDVAKIRELQALCSKQQSELSTIHEQMDKIKVGPAPFSSSPERW